MEIEKASSRLIRKIILASARKIGIIGSGHVGDEIFIFIVRVEFGYIPAHKRRRQSASFKFGAAISGPSRKIGEELDLQLTVSRYSRSLWRC